jgi:hypothetical protein
VCTCREAGVVREEAVRQVLTKLGYDVAAGKMYLVIDELVAK